MTTRNFRVNTGLSIGDIAAVASTNAVTGVSSITLDNSTAPSGNAVLSNKKYVDDQIAAISTSAISSGTTNGVSDAHLVSLSITAASTAGEDASITIKNNNSVALPNNSGDTVVAPGNCITGNGGVTAQSNPVTHVDVVTDVHKHHKTSTA